MKYQKYNLTGILLHLGATTQAGHYVAHIKDPRYISFILWFTSRTQQWYRFDDSKVTPLELNAVGIESTDSKQKSERPLSKDAYMLIYTAQEKGSVECFPPESIISFVNTENEAFEKQASAHAEKIDAEWEKRKNAKLIYQQWRKESKPKSDQVGRFFILPHPQRKSIGSVQSG